MKKITKLKICDCAVALAGIAILASGIQLEATHSGGCGSVRLHIAIGLLFLALSVWHIELHYGRSNWFVRFRKQKKQALRIFWWVSIAAFLSGIVAAIHWLTGAGHSPLGGIHGKIGFLMMAFAIAHVAQRFSFFTRLFRKG